MNAIHSVGVSVTLPRLNRCTGFYEICHEDTLIVEDSHYLLLYRDNRHTRDRRREKKLVRNLRINKITKRTTYRYENYIYEWVRSRADPKLGKLKLILTCSVINLLSKRVYYVKG